MQISMYSPPTVTPTRNNSKTGAKKDDKVTADVDVATYLNEWNKGKTFVDNAIKDFKQLRYYC
jgi:hypothetical protein